MNDRELLKLAAKAAGITLVPYTWSKGTGWDHEGFTVAGEGDYEWNPLESDGAALRLAVKLGIAILHDDASAVRAGWFANQQCPITMDGTGPWFWKEWLRDNGDDPYAATRCAIVRAAASLSGADMLYTQNRHPLS